MKKQKIITSLILLSVMLGSAYMVVISQENLSRAQKETIEKEPDLYLPEPSYLKFISLGHEPLMSDLVLAKALTYFGSHYFERQTFKYTHLKKLFLTAVEMDPMNKEAVLMGANLLSNIDVQSAIHLLETGMFHHPTYWKFPEMAGYIYSTRLNDSHKAGRYYEMASRLPDHPPFVPSLSGKYYEESGRYEEAMRVLYNFYSTTEDKRLKDSFKQSILELEQKIKNKDFQLKAEVIEVLDGETVRFKPDLTNPQFQFMKPVELLRIKGVDLYNIHSADLKEQLFALMQRDYARYYLLRPGANQTSEGISISFEREPNGELVKDKQNRYSGTVTMKYNQVFKPLEIIGAQSSGIVFPPKAEEIDFKSIFQKAGKVVTLSFTVQDVASDERVIYLNTASQYRNMFRVVIPKEYLHYFSESGKSYQRMSDYATIFKALEGKKIAVSGLVVTGDRQMEMKLYFPFQMGR